MIQTQTERTGARLRSPRRPDVRATAGPGTPSLAARLLSDAARPLRFALTGGLAGLLQLVLLAFLTRRGWPELPSNVIAFLLAAQVNFALSSLFTWRDRRTAAPVWRRWLVFHASIAAMAVVNQLVFVVARAAADADGSRRGDRRGRGRELPARRPTGLPTRSRQRTSAERPAGSCCVNR